jgi:hypothetical protein
MAVPSSQIAAREVAQQSAARTVTSAHDGSALLCEGQAATAGSRCGAAEIGSGDTLCRRGVRRANALESRCATALRLRRAGPPRPRPAGTLPGRAGALAMAVEAPSAVGAGKRSAPVASSPARRHVPETRSTCAERTFTRGW